MRININLATERYEVARQFQKRMLALVAVLAAATVLLAGYILYQRRQTRDIDAKISQARQEITTLDSEKAQAQAILNKPVNRTIADESRFLNQLFVRKSLSWTRVFSEMEKLMPYDIHVISMKPEYTNDNQLMLHMVVATDQRDRAVELVKRMEKSKHFRSPQVVAENVTTQGGASSAGGAIQFDIAALYLPFAPDDAEEEKGAPAEQKAPETKPPTKTAQVQGGKR